MKSKRGVIGRFIVTFIATIVIALILIGFVFVSSMIKTISKANAGLVIHDEDMIGIDDGVGYMDNYVKLVEAKGRVRDDISLDGAIGEVGYEK